MIQRTPYRIHIYQNSLRNCIADPARQLCIFEVVPEAPTDNVNDTVSNVRRYQRNHLIDDCLAVVVHIAHIILHALNFDTKRHRSKVVLAEAMLLFVLGVMSKVSFARRSCIFIRVLLNLTYNSVIHQFHWFLFTAAKHTKDLRLIQLSETLSIDLYIFIIFCRKRHTHWPKTTNLSILSYFKVYFLSQTAICNHSRFSPINPCKPSFLQPHSPGHPRHSSSHQDPHVDFVWGGSEETVGVGRRVADGGMR